MEVERNPRPVTELPTGTRGPSSASNAVIADTVTEAPRARTEGCHLLSDIPPPRIAKRFKEF
jgi:hypothetical protein